MWKNPGGPEVAEKDRQSVVKIVLALVLLLSIISFGILFLAAQMTPAQWADLRQSSHPMQVNFSRVNDSWVKITWFGGWEDAWIEKVRIDGVERSRPYPLDTFLVYSPEPRNISVEMYLKDVRAYVTLATRKV